jgi:hypothetical protein|tara:strand:+ start:419 stop:1192 length:774 start_codon:yes stop_codon:yes gene_type:complete
MTQKSIYLVLLVFVVSSCKSVKDVSGNTISSMSSKKIIKNHYEADFDKKTINATIKATYKDKDGSRSISIKLRMRKDSAIWMSGRFVIPVAKILITPSKVRFYEKLGKTYFDGNFELLSKFLGTDVNFEVIQNLLLGQSIQNLKVEKFNSEIMNNSYRLAPKKQKELFDVLFWIDPTFFKMNKQEVRQPAEQKKMMINYVGYREIDKEVFPKEIQITAIEKADRIFLNLEYRAVEFDRKLSFPFTIPSGYKQIKLND